jgi:hypothetical protein
MFILFRYLNKSFLLRHEISVQENRLNTKPTALDGNHALTNPDYFLQGGTQRICQEFLSLLSFVLLVPQNYKAPKSYRSIPRRTERLQVLYSG